MTEFQVVISPADIATIVPEIDRRIIENENKFSMIDVRSGLAGLSLYNYACADFSGSETSLEKANEYLAKCFELINSGYISRVLYRELSEVG